MFVIQHELRRVTAFAMAGAWLNFFGSTHSEQIGRARSPEVAVA